MKPIVLANNFLSYSCARVYPIAGGPELILVQDGSNATILHYHGGMAHKSYGVTRATFDIRRRVRITFSADVYKNSFVNLLLTNRDH